MGYHIGELSRIEKFQKEKNIVLRKNSRKQEYFQVNEPVVFIKKKISQKLYFWGG